MGVKSKQAESTMKRMKVPSRKKEEEEKKQRQVFGERSEPGS